MAKPLVLANGSMFVGLDEHAQIKDLYYDYVGLENHLTEEAVCRVGVFIEGEFSWISDPGWEININYRSETLASKVEAVNKSLEISLDFLDIVYNEKSIFVRNITVHNRANKKRQIRIFLNHQFRMYGMHKKDTVYFDPMDSTIIHYKGRRIALIGGKSQGSHFSDYTVGLSSLGDKEGTWKDAEDGVLSKNAIEHGTVDSTVAFEKIVDADKSFSLSYWICMGKTLKEVKELNEYVTNKSPDHITETTQDYWHAWLNRTKNDFGDLNERAIDLYKKSLLIVRSHVDNNGGILATGDSNMLQYGKDNYNYIWHRDGAFVAMALDLAGYSEVARKFYEFSRDTITEDGYYFHKYRPDKSLGSSWHGFITPDGKHRLPIQEDETTLVVSALWRHYEKTRDIEFIETIYNPLIKKASDFILRFRNANGLPSATYDLWERVWGIHTFTAATVYDALRSASKFAQILGKEDDEDKYKRAADEVKDAISKYLFNPKTGYFYKYIDYEGKETLHDETIDVSSFYGIFKFDVLDEHSPEVEKALIALEEHLWCKTDIGGIARYEGDDYYRVEGEYPGNPWIVTTLWLAQFYIKVAKTQKDLNKPRELIDWVVARSWPSGALAEQVNPYTGESLSVVPLTWSHAEFVTTVILYLEKLKSL